MHAAEAEALGAASGELEQMWSGLTRAQRQVLGAIAEGRAQLLSKSTLAAMGVGKSTAQQARNALEAEGYLRREGPRSSLSIPSWLAGFRADSSVR